MENHQCCQCLWPLRVWGIGGTVRVLGIQWQSLRMKPGKLKPSKHAGAMHMLAVWQTGCHVVLPRHVPL